MSYTGSLTLELHLVSQNNLWVSLVIKSILQQHTTKRWPWKPQDPLTLFATPNSSRQNTLYLYKITNTIPHKRSTITRIYTRIENTWIRTIQEALWSDLVTTTKLEQQSCTLKNFFKKTNLFLWSQICINTCYICYVFCFERRTIFIALNVAVLGSFNPLNQLGLLGLLVSKFRRGGVNWAYKIFASTHNFFSIPEAKRTDCFYMKQIDSSEQSWHNLNFVQCKIVINKEL